MRARTPTPDYALIGHQESWEQISHLVHGLRAPDKPALGLQTLRETVPWIPPRAIVHSRNFSLASDPVDGVYIETFLTPDELAQGALRRGIQRVEEAIGVAVREGARIAALGGFTSILLEGRAERMPHPPGMALTTGNTLTAAFIAKGVERAMAMLRVPLEDATLLVIGATGDVGSACSRYFAPRVRRLLLAARRQDRLESLANALATAGSETRWTTDIRAVIPEADVVIAVASLGQAAIDLSTCRSDALVCDAGYPKNLHPPQVAGPLVFHGGMGCSLGGWTCDSPLLDRFYTFPAPFVGHGCLLEGMVLAMERRFEPFSQGRGNITPARMEEIYAIAGRHGLVPAPFFDHRGLWPKQPPMALTGGRSPASAELAAP
jgi:predicted amino acid dehydrogenase